ncbi:MAG: hypothetical protein DCF29_24875 [Alphaproteobacteria bacterium]|nr:MAG: hypothetical protein DCF29_24875 [Alphaproteobacteria bacterium]
MKKITKEKAAEAMTGCIQNASDLKLDADILKSNGRLARAFTLYYCACEELSKYYML